MANVKVWSGQKPAPTYYADLIYPKKVESGTIRLVMRNQQGVIVENVLDLIPEKGLVLLKVSEDFGSQFPCVEGKVAIVYEEEEEKVEEIREGSGIMKRELDEMREGI